MKIFIPLINIFCLLFLSLGCGDDEKDKAQHNADKKAQQDQIKAQKEQELNQKRVERLKEIRDKNRGAGGRDSGQGFQAQ